MGLIRKLFWIALFLVSTFCFLVLFDHGTVNYVKNFQLDFQNFKTLLSTQIEHKKDESDKIGTAK
jgi:hypothetical protein